MPSHLIKRLDLGKLYLPFLTRVLDVLSACEKRGAVYIATTGYRSPVDQAKLYFQGRTLPGKIVTDARPGLSCHQWGIAVDVVRDVSPAPGLQPSFNPVDYAVLADEADKHELQANIPKGTDAGHIQLPLRRKLNRGDKEIVSLLKDTGSLEAAWALLDVMGPW
jgi:hypothetical protein